MKRSRWPTSLIEFVERELLIILVFSSIHSWATVRRLSNWVMPMGKLPLQGLRCQHWPQGLTGTWSTMHTYTLVGTIWRRSLLVILCPRINRYMLPLQNFVTIWTIVLSLTPCPCGMKIAGWRSWTGWHYTASTCLCKLSVLMPFGTKCWLRTSTLRTTRPMNSSWDPPSRVGGWWITS